MALERYARSEGLSVIHTSDPAPGVLEVILARPERLNAINPVMVDDLLAIVDVLERSYPERYRAVVIRGEGRGFSSGGDIAAFQNVLGLPHAEVESFIAHFHQMARRWYELPMPTIAAIHGAAAGGGAALALLCDLRLAAPDVRIGFSFPQIGLIPDLGSHYTLPRLVGTARALELLYTGELVGAEEAQQMGLVNRIIPGTELRGAAVDLASRLAGAPAPVLRTVKGLLRDSEGMSLVQVMEQEVAIQTERFGSEEFQERVGRFLHKEQ